MTARSRYRDTILCPPLFRVAFTAFGSERNAKKRRGHRRLPSFLAVNHCSTGVKPVVAQRNKSHIDPLMEFVQKHASFAQPKPALARQGRPGFFALQYTSQIIYLPGHAYENANVAPLIGAKTTHEFVVEIKKLRWAMVKQRIAANGRRSRSSATVHGQVEVSVSE
ncbi:MAG TPA: hypothetical protein VF278_00730 [Pirellulales bacterium]